MFGSHMNVEQTRQYYARLTDADLCNCAYCRNYIKEIKAAYPDITVFLDQHGIDIEKPFEAMPIDPVNGLMLYSGVQYVVLGKAEGFKEIDIGEVHIFVTDSHPMTDIMEDHFVIELAPIRLNWTDQV